MSKQPSLYSFQNAFLIIALITLYRAITLYYSPYPLYADEAYYWGWAQHFDWGYYSKPPMVAWTIIGSTSLFGDSEFGVKIGSMFLYLFTFTGLYLLARELFDEKTGFYTAITFATLPAVSMSTMIISTDAPFLLFWSWTLYLFTRAIRTDKMLFWLLAGITGGLGLLSKYTMIMLMASAIVYLALSPQFRRHLKNPKLYLTMIIAAIVYLPNLWWNYANHFASFLHTQDNAKLEGSLFHFDKMFEFLGAQFGVFGPVFFAVLLYMLFTYRRHALDERYKMLLWFIIPFLGLITVISFLSRAHANWAAPVYTAATVLVVAFLVANNRMKLLHFGIGLNIVLALVVYNYHAIADTFGIELSRKTDPYKRVLGWDRFGESVAPILAQYPDAKLLSDSRKELAEMIYYAKPHPFDAYIWNPRGTILNHYELTTDMQTQIGKDFIFVTGHDAAPVTARFEKAEKIEHIRIRVHKDYALEYDVYHLQNFKGYN